MPTLKNLTCTTRWTGTDEALKEYSIQYADGIVGSYLAVPKDPGPFLIEVSSDGYIASGVAVFVYIDGVYQCNRNRRDLTEQRPNFTFKVRQKEEFRRDGSMWGKEWQFQKLNNAGAQADGVEAPFNGEYVGVIEAVVLRCVKDERAPDPATMFRVPTSSKRSAMSEQTRWIHGYDGSNDRSELKVPGLSGDLWDYEARGPVTNFSPRQSGWVQGEESRGDAGQSTPSVSNNDAASQQSFTAEVRTQAIAVPGAYTTHAYTGTGPLQNSDMPITLTDSERLYQHPGLQEDCGPRPYWGTREGQLTTKAFRPHQGSMPPRQPQWQIPMDTKQRNYTSHQVQTAQAVPFMHKLCRPRYLDSHQKPYAVFHFKYRDIASLEKILGIQIEDAQQRTVDPYEGMTKEQLINELRTARTTVKTQQQSASDLGISTSASAKTEKLTEALKNLQISQSSDQSGQQQQQSEAWGGTSWDSQEPTQKRSSGQENYNQQASSGAQQSGSAKQDNNSTRESTSQNESKPATSLDGKAQANNTWQATESAQSNSQFPSQQSTDQKEEQPKCDTLGGSISNTWSLTSLHDDPPWVVRDKEEAAAKEKEKAEERKQNSNRSQGNPHRNESWGQIQKDTFTKSDRDFSSSEKDNNTLATKKRGRSNPGNDSTSIWGGSFDDSSKSQASSQRGSTVSKKSNTADNPTFCDNSNDDKNNNSAYKFGWSSNEHKNDNSSASSTTEIGDRANKDAAWSDTEAAATPIDDDNAKAKSGGTDWAAKAAESERAWATLEAEGEATRQKAASTSSGRDWTAEAKASEDTWDAIAVEIANGNISVPVDIRRKKDSWDSVTTKGLWHSRTNTEEDLTAELKKKDENAGGWSGGDGGCAEGSGGAVDDAPEVKGSNYGSNNSTKGSGLGGADAPGSRKGDDSGGGDLW